MAEQSLVEAVQEHYDLSDEFYQLWLDPTLTYSCAVWAGADDSLEAAQMRKLDYHVGMAAAAHQRRVLDVGCGWGSMLQRLRGAHGVEHAVGLTLSAAQAAYIAAIGDPGLEVRLESWADHHPSEPYDAIVSIGAMEHFSPPRGPRHKLVCYRDFFERCHGSLREGGRMSLQTIAKGSIALDRRGMVDVVFLAREIFRESDLPSLSDILRSSEGLFEVAVIRNDRNDYARTCAEWRRRLTLARAKAISLVGEPAVARYERYLDAVTRQFRLGHAGLLRVALHRI